MKTYIQNFFLTLALLAGIQQVTAQTLTNISISPASPMIVAGSNQLFTATGYYSDGSAQVLTNSGGATSSWATVAGLPEPLITSAVATMNGKVYMASGGTSGIYSTNFYSYDPVANHWTKEKSIPFPPRTDAGGVTVGSNFFMIGGCNYGACSGNTSSRVDVFNSATEIWSNAPAMTLQITGLGAGVINGKIFVTGGLNQNNSYLNSLLAYDPAITNQWTTLSNMPTARQSCSAAVINGKLYVVGGYAATGPTGALEVYDPATGSWSIKTPMPTARFHLGATAVNGLLYAINGRLLSGAITNLVEIYNPVTDTWSVGTPTILAHDGFQAVTISGKIYIAGSAGGVLSTNSEVFTPATSLTWSSGNPSLATINTNGLATGLIAGTTTIKAISGSVSNSTALTVVALPTISMQPTNNTVSPNGSVTLNVAAAGGNLSYQWQLNGTNIIGANGSAYNIPGVASTNVGVYTVVVSNLAGSVTSQAAIIGTTDIKMFAGMIVSGPVGTNYVIQSTGNLTNGWTTRTNLALPSQPYIYIDYSSPTNPQQFYRASPQ